MSRVEEEREADRLAAKLAEQKRVQEASVQKKANEASAFSRKVQGQLVEKRQVVAEAVKRDNLARGAIEQLLEGAQSEHGELAALLARGREEQAQQGALESKLGGRATEEKGRAAKGAEGKADREGRRSDLAAQGQTTAGRMADQKGVASQSEGRTADGATTRERLEERREANGSAGSRGSSSAEAGQGSAGALKADSDKGGGQQGGGKDQNDSSGSAGPSFRFNPALMAPVPVAKKKDTSGSERLRQVANELAQKIVERVRVGTNAAGRVEFQIDLRGDVLSGLSVKVSSHQGKIKAVFQGSNKEVLKMLQEQQEALKEALGARGLSLEEFRIEGAPERSRGGGRR